MAFTTMWLPMPWILESINRTSSWTWLSERQKILHMTTMFTRRRRPKIPYAFYTMEIIDFTT